MKPLKVAVSGGTGFIGEALLEALDERFETIGLTRRSVQESRPGVEWRRCDLFSLQETERALEGADVAVYLVHSMLPTTRLTQGRFQDLDLLLADNFGRAAAKAGVRRIVYLGGLIPQGESQLSAHLASRLEVEDALGAHGVPVTTLRAGLIVGAGGSSLRILVRLVSRLPVMISPRWTAMDCQPIAVEDVVTLLEACIADEETAGETFDIGGPDVLSYREMMLEAGRAMGKRRFIIPVPLFTPSLSRLWVTLVTRTPRALVAPLIQSLRHPMVARDLRLQERIGLPGKPFREALDQAVREEGLLREPTARAVHRLPRPEGRDAPWIAAEYARWLPRFMRPFITVREEEGELRFYVRGIRRALLELTYRPARSSASRTLYEITGGLLLRRKAEHGMPRLEFRLTADGKGALAAVQDYQPRLPWWLYATTQSVVHDLVMRGFARHLRRAPGEPAAAASPAARA
ncbi:MAG: NAD(P)H-binding protein [Myxococcota bacterium]|nr:NAD(P)H-binding protein [Myxococcota bacterium]